MNDTTNPAVITADTGENIPGALVFGDFHHGDGYEWIEAIGEDGWAALPNWGSEGWDLGQWPYVIVAGIRTADRTGNLFGVATYCEGDVTCTYYRTQRAQWEAITEHAFFSWQNGQAHGPADLPAAAAELRRTVPGLDRLGLERVAGSQKLPATPWPSKAGRSAARGSCRLGSPAADRYFRKVPARITSCRRSRLGAWPAWADPRRERARACSQGSHP